ncbi:MAG: glutathione S-transferase C-terminal domain-containing protein [Candidatus Binatus sp.]
MSDKIAVTDVKLKYATIQEAKTMPGLRLILGASAVPGPWREACKGIFHVKKIPYTPVASAGQDGSQRELVEWTAQSSAPVAIWNDERPRSTWIEQLFLAERLQPEPTLIPANADDRVLMFGLINEIAGENGLGWQRRHLLINSTVSNPNADQRTRDFWRRFGGKYIFSEEAAAAAPARVASILKFLAERLDRQKARGSKFFIGDKLSAADIYWATFAALIRPLPPELCPMATTFREMYTEQDPLIVAATAPSLMEHRDFIYREYLELPVVF